MMGGERVVKGGEGEGGLIFGLGSGLGHFWEFGRWGGVRFGECFDAEGERGERGG
jgi:hypothetical protein